MQWSGERISMPRRSIAIRYCALVCGHESTASSKYTYSSDFATTMKMKRWREKARTKKRSLMNFTDTDDDEDVFQEGWNHFSDSDFFRLNCR
jgi:hypothetical protein